ncbi:MAG: hypothetical protein NTV86_16115 [Planctomycetota bacterium]|nr:hypothetical protein [Planctomycetota bacterium]
MGQLSIEAFARNGASSIEPRWIQGAYAWLYGRLEGDRLSGLPKPIAPPLSPPANGCPLLLADAGGAGLIGWASVDFLNYPHAPGDTESLRAAQNASSFVCDWFRQLDLRDAWPFITFRSCREFDGASTALAVFALTLARKAGLPLPEDVCATGCWDLQRSCLAPVAAETLAAKLRKAADWGYRRILLVEGQAGWQEMPGLTPIYLPAAPAYAALHILSHVLGNVGDEIAAGILAVFDQAAVWNPQTPIGVDQVCRATEPFIESRGLVLSRHMAHDMRSRAMLHAGRTAQAAREATCASQALPEVLPEGWLGDYLIWHEPAHRAVIAIDQGRWQDDEAEHATVDRRIARLESETPRRSILLAGVRLHNTRGRRYEYLGRLNEDSGLLRKSWDDRLRFRESWPTIDEYASRLGLRDGGIRRQHNQCIDVLTSYWMVERRLPADWGFDAIGLWPEPLDRPQRNWSMFDLAAFLKWKAIAAQPPDDVVLEEVLLATEDAAARFAGRYPSYVPFEVILQLDLGDESLRKRAAINLVRSVLFSSDLPADSILAVTAIRAENLASKYLDRMPRPIRPRCGTVLSDLAQELLARPERIASRCPY